MAKVAFCIDVTNYQLIMRPACNKGSSPIGSAITHLWKAIWPMKYCPSGVCSMMRCHVLPWNRTEMTNFLWLVRSNHAPSPVFCVEMQVYPGS
jgi:hypothetical protein